MDLTEIIFDTIFTAALYRGVAMPDLDLSAVADTIESENFAFSLDGVDFELLSLPELEKAFNLTGTVWVLLMVPKDSNLEYEIYRATSADLVIHWVDYIQGMIDQREIDAWDPDLLEDDEDEDFIVTDGDIDKMLEAEAKAPYWYADQTL